MDGRPKTAAVEIISNTMAELMEERHIIFSIVYFRQELLHLLLAHGVNVLGPGEAFSLNVSHVCFQGLNYFGIQVGILLDKFGRKAIEEAQHIVDYEALPGAINT